MKLRKAAKVKTKWLPQWPMHVRIVGSLLLAGFIVGYGLGRALSPVYDLSPGGQIAIRDAVGLFTRPTSRADKDKWKGASLRDQGPNTTWREYRVSRDGVRVLSIEVLPDYLTYECGVTRYRYDISQRHLIKEVAQNRDWRISGRPRRGLELMDALTFAVGGLKAYQLNELAPKYLRYLSPRTTGWARRMIAGTISAGSGIAFGMYFGYSSDFNCGNKEVQTLLDKTEFWDSVNKVATQRYSWYFTHQKPGSMEVDPTRGAGSFSLEYQGDMYEALVRAERR